MLATTANKTAAENDEKKLKMPQKWLTQEADYGTIKNVAAP